MKIQKLCYACKEKLEDKYIKVIKYCKVRDHCHYTGEYRGVAHSICNLKYSIPKEIPIVFRNGGKCNYHFIIKEFERQFNCLRESTEKYITFSVSIQKEVTRIDKNGEEVIKTISCRL